MKIDTNPNLSPVASKHYALPIKHHKFVKEEFENLLEARLIKRSMSPYAALNIVVPRKSKPGASLPGIKRLELTIGNSTSKSPRCRLPRQNSMVAKH